MKSAACSGRYPSLMQTITLPRGTWTFDPTRQLGESGGFGAVFEGTSVTGSGVAVKLLHLTAADAAQRELKVADQLSGRDLPHVMPVIDSGLDQRSGRYFIVMPRAERSLHATIKLQGPVPETSAIRILMSIAAGLDSLPDIVHRDLKPANILWHQERWRIADFGIAKFVAEATSERTLKDAMSVHYAAPEQWRMERVTKTTDVYALGCIAYTLLTGNPPFTGSTQHELMRQHTQQDPPPLPASPTLRQIVAFCLRKSPQARPSTASLVAQLGAAETKMNAQRADPLVQAAAQVASAKAAEEAEYERTAAAQRQRLELATDGMSLLSDIMDDLYGEVSSAAIGAQRNARANEIHVGSGSLRYRVEFPHLESKVFEKTQWADVIVGVCLEVNQRNSSYSGRSANLWYGDLDKSGQYRWWETAYWSWGTRRILGSEPAGLVGEKGLEYAVLVVSNITSGVQFAYKPRPIDGEFRDQFVERWKRWLADAALNKLSSPSHLPEKF